MSLSFRFIRSFPRCALGATAIILTIFLALATPRLVRAQSSQANSPSNSATLAATAALTSTVATHADHAPVIDGRGDDAVWNVAPAVTNFRQFDPVEDGDPRFRTEFKVAYDSHNIYVFIRAFDPDPSLIRKTLARRDVRPPSDQLKVMIDSYHDGRTGFEFAVSPGRVKRDYAMYNDTDEDGTWDGVWDVATTIDSLGWTAEFAIPMSQLGFRNVPVHTIGFAIWRDIDRFKERVSWPVFRISKGTTVSQLGTVTGIGDVGSDHPLEVVPYVVTKNVSTGNGAPSYGRAQRLSAGADLKLGVTPSLRLNATVNPDFGQVEADPSVINLGAFETFFSEQRPFFVEGQGRYTVNLNCSVVNCSSEGLFYSRRIGRTPQLLGAYGDASSPTATTILGAAKLSGRIGKSFSVGVLDAVTDRASGSQDRTIEPRTNYGVARVQREFRDGASNIGLVVTSVDRATDSWTQDALRRTATVGGLDFSHRFLNNNYQVSGSYTASDVTGTAAAITQTQMNAVHYYQRPDGKLRVDSSLTSLSGNAQEFLFGKYGGGITRFETSYERQSAGYEVNDIGYLQRADHQAWNNWGSLNFFSPTRLYNSLRFNGNFWNYWTTDGLALEHALNTNVHMILHNSWGLHSGVTFGQLGSTYCDRCSRGGPAVGQSSYIAPWLSIGGDDRRRITPSVSLNYFKSDEGRTSSLSFEPSLAVQATSQLLFSLDVSARRNDDNTQWIGNFRDTATSATHYAFARLHQETIATALRATYIATPELSIQFYAQPFVSNGSYSDPRELSATPRAANYADRYVAYAAPASSTTGFSDREFKSNTVVRWEYRPGSTLYVVWTQGRQMYDDAPDTRGWSKTYPDLLQLRPDNTFLVKLSYWLNR